MQSKNGLCGHKYKCENKSALLNLITKLINKQSQINLNSYTQSWKYEPLDINGIEEQRENILEELLDVR